MLGLEECRIGNLRCVCLPFPLRSCLLRWSRTSWSGPLGRHQSEAPTPRQGRAKVGLKDGGNKNAAIKEVEKDQDRNRSNQANISAYL